MFSFSLSFSFSLFLSLSLFFTLLTLLFDDLSLLPLPETPIVLTGTTLAVAVGCCWPLNTQVREILGRSKALGRWPILLRVVGVEGELTLAVSTVRKLGVDGGVTIGSGQPATRSTACTARALSYWCKKQTKSELSLDWLLNIPAWLTKSWCSLAKRFMMLFEISTSCVRSTTSISSFG